MSASEEMVRQGYEEFNAGQRDPDPRWWHADAVPMEMELSHIWFVEDGKFKRVEEYFDRAEGLAVAGIPA